jgi:uncharacterized membrane protein YbhN (UPF0104 family)
MRISKSAWTLAKWTWFALILVFALLYALDNKSIIVDNWARLSFLSISISTLLIVVAKLALAETMGIALRRVGFSLPFQDRQKLYNSTQIAKYIPGSVWQFLSRAAILRERGLDVTSIRDALFMEVIWIIITASAVGLLVLPSWRFKFSGLINSDSNPGVVLLVCIIPFIIVIFILLLYARRTQRFIAWIHRLLPPRNALIIQVFTWFGLGLSFWVLLLPYSQYNPPLIAVTGIYASAWVVGFLVPFAPAGLGIREAILVLGLSHFSLGGDLGVFLASLHRILYFFVEVILAILSFLNTKPSKFV